MPESPTPPAETFNESTGLTNVDPSIFMHEDEGNGSENHEDTPPEGDDPPENGENAEKKKEVPSKTDEGDGKGDDPNADPSKPKTEEKKEEKVYAGKYKTVDDLKAALVQLGIDPDDYGSDAEMETAYKVAQATYTRVRQHETEKKSQTITTEEIPTDIEALFKEANAKIDYSKATNAQQLGEATLRAVLETLMPVMQKLKVDPEALAGTIGEKITTQSTQVNTLLTELREVETKVPRLRTDKKFRDDFADFVAGQKLNQTYTTLMESITKFVGGKPVTTDPKVTKQNKEDKGSAGALPDNSDGNGKGKQLDEADEILGAFKEHQVKFG